MNQNILHRIIYTNHIDFLGAARRGACGRPRGPGLLTAADVGPGAVNRGAGGGDARTALGHRRRRGARGPGRGQGGITWEGKTHKN